MEIILGSVGILVALVVILTIVNRRERRTRESTTLDESGILDARRHNDGTAAR